MADATQLFEDSSSGIELVIKYKTAYDQTYKAFIEWYYAFFDGFVALRIRPKAEKEKAKTPVRSTQISGVLETGYEKLSGWVETLQELYKKVNEERY